jgi:hypothetical protein
MTALKSPICPFVLLPAFMLSAFQFRLGAGRCRPCPFVNQKLKRPSSTITFQPPVDWSSQPQNPQHDGPDVSPTPSRNKLLLLRPAHWLPWSIRRCLPRYGCISTSTSQPQKSETPLTGGCEGLCLQSDSVSQYRAISRGIAERSRSDPLALHHG